MMKFALTRSVRRISVFVAITLVSGCASTASEFLFEPVVEGIAVPWGMVWLPNGDMLITERKGELYRVDPSGRKTQVAGVPDVHVNGQGGLLDIELHPGFATNGWVYLTYSSRDGSGDGSNTALMRARLIGDQLRDQEVLYKAGPNTGRGQHYGSRIEFDDDGYLYFSAGDRGARDVNPQDLTRDNGKIYRLHDDGRVPSDNPFVDREDAKGAIYSWGHRNPQGMAKHPETGQIWIHEHGPRGGDEVNVIVAGQNYGWPILSYGINYSGTDFAEGTEREGFAPPAWYWVPSIAPSGMTFVTGDNYPEFKGGLLVGSLKFSYVVLCRVEGDAVTSQEILFENIGRVRNVRQGPDGFIYVAVEGKGIVRVVRR
jgi:glucose/arabinose dehydrogenase